MTIYDVLLDIMIFRGFKRQTFKEKLRWVFMLYPVAIVTILSLGSYLAYKAVRSHLTK